MFSLSRRFFGGQVNGMPLKQYFDDLLRSRQHIRARWLAARNQVIRTKHGKMSQKPMGEDSYIDLPQATFAKMVSRVETPEDVDVMKDVYLQFLGHRNILPQKMIDSLFVKAHEVGGHENMQEFLGLHAHLLYHPANEVISLYVDSAESQGYDALKSLFYAALKGRYTMSRQTGFMKRVLKAAHAAGDKQTVIDCYLDVLDYSAESAEIDDECFALALDSVSFTETIDHVLVGHIKEQMDARGLDSRV
jgi:hypothetical protein